MDFIPVSPLVSNDSYMAEAFARLASSVEGLTQQVKVLTKEKNDLAARVDALEKQNRELTANKRSQESLGTTTAMPPPPAKRTVVKNPQLPNSIYSESPFYELQIRQPFWEFAKNYRAFKETHIPGVFTTSVFEESSIARKRLMHVKTCIDGSVSIIKGKKLSLSEIRLIEDLEKISLLINAILDTKPLTDLVANRIVEGEQSGKLYSVPDKVLSLAIIHESNPRRSFRCSQLLDLFFRNDDIVEFASNKARLEYQYAKMFAALDYRKPLNDPDNASFLENKLFTVPAEVLPGRLVYSELVGADPSTPAPEIVPLTRLSEVPVPPATPIPDPDQFPEVLFAEEGSEPPLTPYGGI